MPEQKNSLAIFWFRQDLRLADNPGLSAAAANHQVLPLYIVDDNNAGPYCAGAASRWWLHHCLQALNRSLDGKLDVYTGDPESILRRLVEVHNITAVYWNRCYEPWRVARDKNIKSTLRQMDISVESFNGSLLWEPWQVRKKDDTPYRVFTPFYRKRCLTVAPPRAPLAAPANLRLANSDLAAERFDALGLLPDIRWDKGLLNHWEIGEQAAAMRLNTFLDNDISGYKEGRNFPAKTSVSRLSPSLHFGELSPNQAWFAAHAQGDNSDIDHFCNELAWREFSYSLLFHFPDLANKNLQAKFDAFPWQNDDDALKAWQDGQTGYPIVDAGMRELWRTGYMHNRVRMIAGSFLVKNLLIDWRAGERWFWDCLADADLANNSASWQWIAGCGADAAPYFRIFNPTTQGQKFDPDGVYIRRYVPELADLPTKYLFDPSNAPAAVLAAANISLGEDYPAPIVDLKESRERALNAFRSLRDAVPPA